MGFQNKRLHVLFAVLIGLLLICIPAFSADLVLTIDANKVFGYSNGITIQVDRDTNASGYAISVYDVENGNAKVTPTVDAPVNSGNTTTLNIHGSSLVNGKVYKLVVYKYKTSGGSTIKSNTVSTYAVPNAQVTRMTVQPFNTSVRVNSRHIAGSSGVRYYVYDNSTGKQVTRVTIDGTNAATTISGLENGKLYYVYCRPYTTYNDKYRWGPQSVKIYFVPVASPSGSNVVFSNTTTAVISTKANSTADGIRVLYRVAGGALKNGCEAASTQCTIKNLNSKTAYEFYLMRYNVVNNIKHYGSGITFQYTPPALSKITAPQKPLIGTSGNTFTFKITKSSDTEGLSVLYREGNGSYQLACEKAAASCTAVLDITKQYTFYIMQYKIQNGKKVYSPGITVKNVFGTKSADLVLASDSEYAVVDEPVDEIEIYNAVADYLSEDELMSEEAFTLIGYDQKIEADDVAEVEQEPEEEFSAEGQDDDESCVQEDDFIEINMDGTIVTKAVTVENDSDEISEFFFISEGTRQPVVPNF